MKRFSDEFLQVKTVSQKIAKKYLGNNADNRKLSQFEIST